MQEQKFKTGDKVVHKTGTGPTMVVVEYEPADSLFVTCQWVINNDFTEKSFHQDLLQPYRPGEVFFSKKTRNNHF